MDNAVWDKLDIEQTKRTKLKLATVRKSAAIQAAGMLKGTLKYSYDTTDVRTLLEHLLQEGADQQNYNMMLVGAVLELLAKNDAN